MKTSELLVTLAFGAFLGAVFAGGVMMPGIMKDRVEAAFDSCRNKPIENLERCVLLDFK